jgi:ribosome-associated toxin RatA of RatAB toxin-antitoxin module
MKFKLETLINKPRTDVWQAFDNIENMQKWQPALTNNELLSGTPGQVGAISKLTYKEGEREFTLIEKVIHRDELNELDGVYENNFADNIIKNRFSEQGKNQTRWVIETEFKFKTLVMKILGNVLKKNYVKRTERDMQRFKEMAEGL